MMGIGAVIAIPLLYIVQFSNASEAVYRIILGPVVILIIIYIFYSAKVWNKYRDEMRRKDNRE